MVAECTFAFDEDTHLILSAIRRPRLGSVPLETCTHRKSCNNFHRNCFQLQFARTSPSTFLFLLSSQCQRADLTSHSGRTSEATASYLHQTKQTHHPVARQIACPVRSRCQWEQLKSFASSASRFLVKFFFTVNRFFSIFFSVRFELTEENFEVTSKSDYSFFSVACRSSLRRLAPRSAAVSGVIGMTFGAVNPLFQTP